MDPGKDFLFNSLTGRTMHSDSAAEKITKRIRTSPTLQIFSVNGTGDCGWVYGRENEVIRIAFLQVRSLIWICPIAKIQDIWYTYRYQDNKMQLDQSNIQSRTESHCDFLFGFIHSGYTNIKRKGCI